MQEIAKQVVEGKKSIKEVLVTLNEDWEKEKFLYLVKKYGGIEPDKAILIKQFSPLIIGNIIKKDDATFSKVQQLLNTVKEERQLMILINSLPNFGQNGLKVILKYLNHTSEIIRQTAKLALQKAGVRLLSALAKLILTVKYEAIVKGAVDVLTSFEDLSKEHVNFIFSKTKDDKILYWLIFFIRRLTPSLDLIENIFRTFEYASDLVKEVAIDTLSQWNDSQLLKDKLWEKLKQEENKIFWLRLEGLIMQEPANLLDYLNSQEPKERWLALQSINYKIAQRIDIFAKLWSIYVEGDEAEIERAAILLEEASYFVGTRLLEFVFDSRQKVAKYALQLLKKQGSLLIKNLLFLLKKGNNIQRYNAAFVIGELNIVNDEVIQYLKEGLSDGDEWVRYNCGLALAKLLGKEAKDILPQDLAEKLSKYFLASADTKELINMLRDKKTAQQAFNALLEKGKDILEEINKAYQEEEDEDARYLLLKLKRQLSK